MHEKRPKNIQTGALGEEIAVMFLMKHGFSILARNFREKCGEIDIVAKKQGIIHFVEVKTVSRESYMRGEDNMHTRKINKVAKTVQMFLLKSGVPHETPFQIDGIVVGLDTQASVGRVRLLEHINIL